MNYKIWESWGKVEESWGKVEESWGKVGERLDGIIPVVDIPTF